MIQRDEKKPKMSDLDAATYMLLESLHNESRDKTALGQLGSFLAMMQLQMACRDKSLVIRDEKIINNKLATLTYPVMEGAKPSQTTC